MVRTQDISNYRRYRNPSITVRQTVKSGRRILPQKIAKNAKNKRRPLRLFFGKMFNIVKLGLFLGAAVCPITCIFVVGWMLLD